MKETEQLNLPGVPRAKQGREVPPQWEWTEAEVWTERMLATLERGVKGGKWHSLIDKVWNQKVINKALETVVRKKGAAGVDGESTQRLKDQREEIVAILSRQIREDRYLPKPVKRVWIEKLGSQEKRPLGVPVVRDRVVNTALVYVLEPIFEKEFAEHSYGFRPGRSAQQAIARVEFLLEQGNHWVIDADLKGYFDTIPQDKLLQAIAEKVADGKVLGLIEKYLKQGVMETGKGWTPTSTGTPQGAVLSPLLSNLYLNPLDHQMAQWGKQMTRYADDFVIQCPTREEAEQVLDAVRQWVEKAGLTLHPEKTRIIDARQRGGFEFLGWHFERGYKWPREKSVKRFKETLRAKTPRNLGKNLQVTIVGLNRQLRGWGQYFSGGNGNVYVTLDKWLRMRLRSILRRRSKRKGRGRGRDHQRYPNAYFAELGLISLKALSSAKRVSPAS
jgi:RNA-directed DNA polymerase